MARRKLSGGACITHHGRSSRRLASAAAAGSAGHRRKASAANSRRINVLGGRGGRDSVLWHLHVRRWRVSKRGSMLHGGGLKSKTTLRLHPCAHQAWRTTAANDRQPAGREGWHRLCGNSTAAAAIMLSAGQPSACNRRRRKAALRRRPRIRHEEGIRHPASKHQRACGNFSLAAAIYPQPKKIAEITGWRRNHRLAIWRESEISAESWRPKHRGGRRAAAAHAQLRGG